VAQSKDGKRQANIAATERLREMHPEDYRKLQIEEYEKRDIEVPLTAEEKADRQMRKLLADFPELGERYNLGPALNVESPQQD
jgi:hypothetical protein